MQITGMLWGRKLLDLVDDVYVPVVDTSDAYGGAWAEYEGSLPGAPVSE